MTEIEFCSDKEKFKIPEKPIDTTQKLDRKVQRQSTQEQSRKIVLLQDFGS